ncbi:MAG: Zn-dependent protease with chaperone function [Granulosicoccus sp.]
MLLRGGNRGLRGCYVCGGLVGLPRLFADLGSPGYLRMSGWGWDFCDDERIGAMDFFEAQEQARRKTKWLVLWFILAVIGVVVAVNALIFFALGGGESVGILIPVSVATAAVILGASGYKSMQLNGGGAVVAKDLGGRLVMPGSTDFEEKRLLNIVEEMAIASGMPVPQVYLMDEEEGINAFAAGTEPSNAVIGVTRGCVQRLSRDELAGVVAHEFSHILNGDMRLNMRLMGLVFGLLVISIMGRGMVELLRFQSLSSRRSNSKEGGGIVMAMFLVGIGLIVIGSLGVFFGRLIQAAVSRQREFLADASAVQFTRNPEGIAGALKKIGGAALGSKMKSPKASEASHMFFSSGGLFSFGLATHPPLAVRIKTIEESWDGKFSESQLKPLAEGHVRKEKRQKGAFDALPGVLAMSAVEEIGNDERREVSTGEKIHDGLAEHWKVASRDREEAQALIFGLLLAEDDELLAGEISFLKKSAGEEATTLALNWQSEVRGLHSARKIALIDLALPTLRGLSDLEYRRFVEITRWLIASDTRVDLFEFMIQRVIERHLGSYFERRGFQRVRYTKFRQLMKEANLLVSTIAEIGAGSEAEAIAAYAVATEDWPGDLRRKGTTALGDLDKVLEKFDQASPLVKKELLIACGKAASKDGDLSSREAEMLRSIADSIGCPVPPFVAGLEESEN